MKDTKKIITSMRVPAGKRVSLADYDPQWTGSIRDREQAQEMLQEGLEELAAKQVRLYAQNTYALLVIFQALDAAGKDSTIKHVMSGVDPQGCQVFSFKAPSPEERDHDYLWRSVKALPERGRIGIHNRSYYEEVLVARVHPEILASQQLPEDLKRKDVWRRRFKHINHFESFLVENAVVVLKFYLNVSKAEQKKRFLERIDEHEKNWKFSLADVDEREHWKDYRRAYEDVLSQTSTRLAPWYVVPADHKWFTRLAVAAVIVDTLERLDLHLPPQTPEKKRELNTARRRLLAEK
jgi:PPK2 family polyphosphate:nucleotide phosphotransferase